MSYDIEDVEEKKPFPFSTAILETHSLSLQGCYLLQTVSTGEPGISFALTLAYEARKTTSPVE